MKLLEECKQAKRIGISGHIRPDGDCVGSCMGLYLYLKKVRPDADLHIFLEKPADIFSCISSVEEIDSEYGEQERFDVFFALDTASDRLGGAEAYFNSAVKKINIDHHISNKGCGDVNYVVPTASSTSELIYDLTEKEQLDEEIAKALYIGIIHDTGVFQYSCTAPETMETAAALMRTGIDAPRIIEETFFQKTYEQNRILQGNSAVS